MDDLAISAGFSWTKQPFIDFGIATLMACCDLNEPDAFPEQLTVEQVKKFTREALPAYFSEPDLFKSVVMCFPNLMNLNPKVSVEKRSNDIRNFLEGFLKEASPELPSCPFFKIPSVGVVTRKSFPLLSGDTVINFYPRGELGIPVSGQAMTAIQAIIFGALRSQGRLMVLATDDRNLLRDVVREWATLVQKRIQLSKQGQEPGDIAPPKTMMVETLAKLQQRRLEMRGQVGVGGRMSFGASIPRYFGSATIYHFSNSGQGPSLELYALPSGILDFILQAQLPEYYPAWVEIRRRWWPKPKAGKKGVPISEEAEPGPDLQTGLSNRFYNELFNLPEGSVRFVRLYFFITMRALIEDSNPINERLEGYREERIQALWKLTELLIKEVLGVQTQRIEDIKELADRLARIALNDPARYRQLMQVRRKWPEIRQLLRQISRRQTEQGQPPVVTLDQFLSIFEMGEEAEYVDWGLAWDLVLIRLMEQVYALDPDFLKKHPDAATSEQEEGDLVEAATTTV